MVLHPWMILLLVSLSSLLGVFSGHLDGSFLQIVGRLDIVDKHLGSDEVLTVLPAVHSSQLLSTLMMEKNSSDSSVTRS